MVAFKGMICGYHGDALSVCNDKKEESHERRTDTSNDLYRRSGEDQSQRRRNARVLSGTTNEDPGIATAGGRKANGNGHKERSISGDRKGCNTDRGIRLSLSGA